MAVEPDCSVLSDCSSYITWSNSKKAPFNASIIFPSLKKYEIGFYFLFKTLSKGVSTYTPLY